MKCHEVPIHVLIAVRSIDIYADFIRLLALIEKSCQIKVFFDTFPLPVQFNITVYVLAKLFETFRNALNISAGVNRNV